MKFIRSILLALSLTVASPAFAQLPAIDAVAGPSTSAQLRRILTDETGTGAAIFGGGDANTLINLNGSAVATGTVAAARLPNAGVTTINGVSCTIGGICTITASAHSITVGVTDVLSGTSNGLLYNNAGDLGNLATSASGVLVTSAGSVPSISTTLPSGLAMGTPTSLTLTNATGLPNAGLVNSSTTVNGQTCTLGLTCTITAVASSLVPGTTTLTGGALNANGLLFNTGNVLTNLASGNNGVLATNATGTPAITDQEDVLGYVNIKSVMGAAGNGTADDAPAFTAAFARTDSPTIYLPPGTYRIPCGNYFTAASAVSFVGAGQGVSTIKLDAGCTITSDIFKWDGKSGVSVRNLTIDFNTPMVPSTVRNGVAVWAYSGNAANTVIQNIGLINTVDRMIPLSPGAAAGGFTVSNALIANNLITMTPGTLQNQCIAFTTNENAGRVDGHKVVGNTCVGSGIQIDGTNFVVQGNDVSAWKFGTGIFGAFNNPVISPQSCQDGIIAGNVIHDTTAGVDVNNTSFGGIENSCRATVLSGNTFYNLGGAGILNYASDSLIEGNSCRNVGFNGPAAGGVGDQSCIHVAESYVTGAPFNSANVTVTGNKVWVDGGFPLYGYYETDNLTSRVTIRGNDITGATQNLRIVSPNTSSDVEYISTKGSLIGTTASLEWTGLDTASFKSWSLTCRQLTPAAAAKIGVQVGQGPTPTWMTGATYVSSQAYNNGAIVASVTSATDTAIWIGSGNYDNTATAPANFQMTFGDLAYVAGYRLASFAGGYLAAGVGYVSTSGSGAWIADTNPITAIRVVASSGNFYGSCTLSGRP